MDDKTKEKISAFAATLRGAAKPAFDFFVFILPYVITLVRTAYEWWMKLPQNAILFINGTVFCFFGGTFPLLFAALQAAEHGGRAQVVDALQILANQALVIIEESKKDDKVDKDGDGKEDVKQLSAQDFATRKTLLVLRKMDPEKIDQAIATIYTVWVSVVAVLSVEFAKTVSLALTIADFLKKPCDRFVTPLLKALIPDEYDKWVPVTLSWITKMIAMSMAWYIQSIISATTSALKGGLMMSRALYMAMVYRGITLGGLIPEDHDASSIDEVMSYGFAALGFYFQFQSGFTLPAPFNIILFPFQMAEQYIRYTVTYGKKIDP